MANNLGITTGTDALIKTTEEGGVHVSHNIIDQSALPSGASTEATLEAVREAVDALANALDDGELSVGDAEARALLLSIGSALAGVLTVSGEITANLGTVAGLATQTTLADILAKISATPATEGKQDAIIGLLSDVLSAIEGQSPAGEFASVTPDDDNDLPEGSCRSILVVTDGDLEFRGADEGAGSHTIPVRAGQMWPIKARRILEGTTAEVLAAY